MHFDDWKNTNLFTSQPLRKLTQPYFGFVQRYYLVLGLIQLLFMICFSACYTPDACSLANMFGAAPGSDSLCNQSRDAVEVDENEGANSTRLYVTHDVIGVVQGAQGQLDRKHLPLPLNCSLSEIFFRKLLIKNVKCGAPNLHFEEYKRKLKTLALIILSVVANVQLVVGRKFQFTAHPISLNTQERCIM